MKISVASWNIAGATRITDKNTNKGTEDISYFSNKIRETAADVVCLQEVHISPLRSIAREIAGSSGYKYFFEAEASPSHNNPDYQLGVAILSKWNIDSEEVLKLPNPHLEKKTASGKTIYSHDKVVQIVKMNNICFGNTQLLPVHVFGLDYSKGDGEKVLIQIEKEIISQLDKPVVFCGDFNHDFKDQENDLMLKQLRLTDILPRNEMTFIYLTSVNKHPDHIFVSDDIKPIHSEIIQTESDHFLCLAEIKTVLSPPF